MPSDFLLPDSLEWALKHIDKFGDTNLFPRPFEIEAIKSHWVSVRNHLTTADLATYPTRAGLRILVPKPGMLFRVTHQLDPLDALIYTATVYEASNSIEQSRLPENDKVACSYRIHSQPNGGFFGNGNGWSDFHTRSKELAESGDYSHVVVADVSDCYNQLYHHRVQSALESANVPVDRTKNIERLLLRFTARQSRGLPVGPLASIPLAEITFNDIDTRLINQHRTYVRYVDDFHIFCRDRHEAFDALHDLTDYLYTAHRLSLQLSKTKIVPVTNFLHRDLRNPEEDEIRGRSLQLRSMVDEILRTTGYEVEIEEIPPAEQNRVVMENLEQLLREAIVPPVDHRTIRYVLVRSTSLRVRRILPIVTANLERLLPNFRETASYLMRVQRPQNIAEISTALRRLAFDSDFRDIPYIKLWVLQMAVEVPGLMSYDDATLLCHRCPQPLHGRYEALIAKHYNKIDWMRASKENWKTKGPWERRATIFASTVLPRAERFPWLDTVIEEGDILDQAVAVLARTSRCGTSQN